MTDRVAAAGQLAGTWATSLAFVAVAGAVTVIVLVWHRTAGPGTATTAGDRRARGEHLWPR